MDSVLEKIISADKAARERTEQANEYRKEQMNSLGAQKEDIMNDEISKAHIKALELNKSRRSQSEKHLAKLKQESNIIISKMEDLYKKDCDKWVNEIIENVTEK